MDFSEDMFRRCPVWKWNSSMDGYCAVDRYEPLPEDEATLFLSALFVTPNGEKYRGYLVGLESFYAFGIFIRGAEYIFNYRLPGRMAITLAAIRAKSEGEAFELFPLEYRTDLRFEGKSKISGVLMAQ